MPRKSRETIETAEVVTYLSREDREKIRERAQQRETSVSDYLRQLIAEDMASIGVQLRPVERGGAREGAGRKPTNARRAS